MTSAAEIQARWAEEALAETWALVGSLGPEEVVGAVYQASLAED